MNQNLIIGVLVALVVLGGGYFLFTSMNGLAGPEATSTTPSASPSTDTTPSPTPATATVPSVVSDTSVAPTNSTAVVTGKVTPNGAPTTYWYEYGQSTTLGAQTFAQAIGSGWSAIASPGYITGLHANTTYYFRLSARNSFGTVNGATYSFSTNNNPPQPVSPPTATTNAATGVARVNATLNAQVNPHSSPTTYWFEYGNTQNFGSVTAFSQAGSGNVSSAVSISVSGLDPLTKYYFRVNAQNQYGTVNGATQSFTTTGPAAPGAPAANTTSATHVTSSGATLNGSVKPNGADTTYWFEYSLDAQLGTVLGTVNGAQALSSAASTLSVSVDATGLAKNTKYFFRVIARNQFGTTRGDIVTFRTKS